MQDRLELALTKFTQQNLTTTCAGRTDAGVHAVEQVIHFDTEIERTQSSWVRGLNSHLPSSIAVQWATTVRDDLEQEFHARFSARARTYHYLIHNRAVRSPLWFGKAAWVFRPLDVDRMQAAAECLIGTHDFSAFRSIDCQAKTPVKTMYQVALHRQDDLIVVKLRANAFLHHMVRNIIGSLVYVGTGRNPIEWIAELLTHKNRHLAAPTFSPDGLYLTKIDYDPNWQLPMRQSLPFGVF